MKNENNIISPIGTKSLLEVAVNTSNRIPLEFFKKVIILFSKNPQRIQKQRNLSKIKEIFTAGSL